MVKRPLPGILPKKPAKRPPPKNPVVPDTPLAAKAGMAKKPAAGNVVALVTGTKTVNLALQGGGSHGAFTWGVLDRLLEEDRLLIEGVSGTSAGAMNAAMMAQGWHRGGREGARRELDQFWNRIGGLAMFLPPQRSLFDRVSGNWNIDRSPTTYVTDLTQYAFSPYQTNPMGVNPVRDLLVEMLDEKSIRDCQHIKIFITATSVETGKPRVFERDELTTEAIMASATLPFTFHATEIDGLPYWDGGYMGNPSIWPMIYACKSPDVVIIQINPLVRPGTPKTTVEIINRVNEISFNSSLLAELRAIAFVQRLIADGLLKEGVRRDLKHMFIHMIEAERAMIDLGAASKMNAELDFLLHLKELGRHTADRWLTATWGEIGKRNSVDLKALLA